MKLSSLFNNLEIADIEVNNIMYDYRQVCENSIFFCLVDLYFDGHNFINVAIENGAKVIVHSRQLKSFRNGIKYIFINDLDDKFLSYVHRFYEDITHKILPIGIIGSYGKDVSASFLYQLIKTNEQVVWFSDKQVISNIVDFHLDCMCHLSSNYLMIYWLYVCYQLFQKGVKYFIFSLDDKFVRFGLLKNFSFKSVLLTNYLIDEFNYQFNLSDSFVPYRNLFLNLENNIPVILDLDDELNRDLVSKIVNPIFSISKNYDSNIKLLKVNMRLDGIEYRFLLNNDVEYSNKLFINGLANLKYVLLAFLNGLVLGYSAEYILDCMHSFVYNYGGLKNITAPHLPVVIIDSGDSVISIDYALNFVASHITKPSRLLVAYLHSESRKLIPDIELGELFDKYSDVIFLNNCEIFIQEKRLTTRIHNHPYVIIDDVNELFRQMCLLARDQDVIMIFISDQNRLELESGGHNLKFMISNILKEMSYEIE